MEFVNKNRIAIVAIVVATTAGLGSGTNYAFSAWGPQFGDRLKLTAVETNVIAAAANSGMNLFGVPLGFAVDRFGSKRPMLIGAFLIGIGYYLLHAAFVAGPGVYGPVSASVFAFMIGIGSTCAFTAAIKTAALSLPSHQGTATAFPLAAFGLSALFFTGLPNLLAGGDTANMLLILAIGTFLFTFVPSFFIPNIPEPESEVEAEPREAEYVALGGFGSSSSPSSRPSRSMSIRTMSNDHQPMSSPNRTRSPPGANGIDIQNDAQTEAGPDERMPILRRDNRIGPAESDLCSDAYQGIELSIAGLLAHPDFWLLFTLLGLLSGTGVMTIYNIGHDVQALWQHHDPSTPAEFILHRQLVHVSLISAFSFTGRLLSGPGSDLLAKRRQSRFLCVLASAFVLAAAQLAGYSVAEPSELRFLSVLTGLGYGMLYGCFPAIVSQIFGIRRLSQNWGLMTLGSVLGGTVTNIVYGRVFDAHSTRLDVSTRDGTDGVDGASQGAHPVTVSCVLGRQCYREAYLATFFACLASAAVVVVCIRRERRRQYRPPQRVA